MARFHLPLASHSETLFRVTASYLLSRFFLKQNGKEVGLELSGLKKIYKNMHILNKALVDRLRAATKTDSSINAVVALDMFTSSVPFDIEDSLEELRNLFNPFVSKQCY